MRENLKKVYRELALKTSVFTFSTAAAQQVLREKEMMLSAIDASLNNGNVLSAIAQSSYSQFLF